ncbi:hypothetical protein Q5752_005387 [Cryptotrichosporon argae]
MSDASSSAKAPPPAPAPAPAPALSARARVGRYLQSGVDSKTCDLISIYACFLTGFTSAISFTACYIWCGFQTGNVAQLGLALARTFDPAPTRTRGFQKPDQQALTSLLSFLVGTSLGRLGDRVGAKNRSWLVGASVAQALMAAAAAVAVHFSSDGAYAFNRGDPAWRDATGMVALGFLSATLGLQGIIGKRIGSPMNTTVVLTTTWVEIANDPLLFAPRAVASRDVRLAGVAALVVGAFVSRALIGPAGDAGTIGVLCALRIAQTVWWVVTPSPKK